ncbi:MAG: hypothetical protein MZV65_12865 [Chromatiales bacterium]|nr:hypothetical protein [Chromatiales bacterium]
MTTVTVRYFASIRERLGRGKDRIDAVAGQGVACAEVVAAGRPVSRCRPTRWWRSTMEYARPESAGAGR